VKKILITGSEGFIGTNLKEHFKNKYDVLGLDCKISIFHDIRYKNYISKYIKDYKPDVIIHLAANPDVSISTVYPQEDLTLNVNGTLNMLELAKEIGVKLFIFTSSACVYGDTTVKKITEKHPVCPTSQYGVGKFSAEEYCRFYFRKYNLPTVVFRQFNMYGKGQNCNFAIPNLIRRIKECSEKKLFLYGTEEDARDFTNVKDLCSAFEQAIKFCPAGETFNIGSGKEIKIYDVANKIKSLLNKKIDFYYAKKILGGKILRMCADNSKVKKILKWSPKISIDDGLNELVINH
jgi:UDP-glucose 4-epimerase